MTSALTALMLLAVLAAAVLLGRFLRRHLPAHHLTEDSRDTVKLAVGLVATMTALLLGLLVTSAKNTYDAQRTEVIQMAAKVTFLDRILAVYGPEAADARTQLRAIVEEAVRRMWIDREGERSHLISNTPPGDALFASIHGLSPKDDTQRALKAQAATLAIDLGNLRMLLLAQMVPSIPKPLLVAVACWLGVTFFLFSLIAPPNATTSISLIVAAASVAAAVFLILELDQPLGGLIRIPGESMHIALSQLGK